jgi:hypothetical protein
LWWRVVRVLAEQSLAAAEPVDFVLAQGLASAQEPTTQLPLAAAARVALERQMQMEPMVLIQYSAPLPAQAVAAAVASKVDRKPVRMVVPAVAAAVIAALKVTVTPLAHRPHKAAMEATVVGQLAVAAAVAGHLLLDLLAPTRARETVVQAPHRQFRAAALLTQVVVVAVVGQILRTT